VKRRLGLILLVAVLGLSLAANALLGYAAWRLQGEYRTLAKQFVKTKQELAQARSTPGAAPAAARPEPAPNPAAVPAAAPAAAAPAATDQAASPVTGGSATVAAIREEYRPRLLAIQNECEGQLGTMLTEASAEYKQLKASGKEVDVAALGGKYMARADSLRRACDRKVESALRQMSAELDAGGLPQDLVDEVREAYEARIAERQAEILAKAPQ
jgi:3-oxoacyl-ACP reductase-like protein